MKLPLRSFRGQLLLVFVPVLALAQLATWYLVGRFNEREARQQIRMRRIAGHRLGQIQHRPGAALIARCPTAHGGNGRSASCANTRGKRQIHTSKKPPPRAGVHGL